MGNQIYQTFFQTHSLCYFFVQTPHCHSIHHPKNIPPSEGGREALHYVVFPSPDGDTSSQQYGNHKYIFCETTDINENTYNLLTCDILICCYLPHQKKEMVSFLRERCISLLHEAAPIILWEMPKQKGGNNKNDKGKMQILIEETPSKRSIILIKGGEYPEFLQQIIKTKFLNKFTIEKKKSTKGTTWRNFDRSTYEEFEKKILQSKKGYDSDDSDLDSDDTDSDDDIATYEIQEVNKSISNPNPPANESASQAPPPPPTNAPPPPPPPPPPMMGPPPPIPLPNELSGSAVSLKKIHWKNIEAAALKNSIWIEKYEIQLGKDLEEELLEQFEIKAKKAETKKMEAAVVNIVEASRSQNIEIVLRGVQKTMIKKGIIQTLAASNDAANESDSTDDATQEAYLSEMFSKLVEIIYAGDVDNILSDSECEAIAKSLPMENDLKALMQYKKSENQHENLAVGDQWLLYSLDYPLLHEWLQAIFWMRNINTEIEQCKDLIIVHHIALNQLRSSKAFHNLLYFILMVGKLLNQGSALASYQGYQFDCLLKLSQIQANQEKVTLLDFIVREAMKNGMEFEELFQQLSKLKEASTITHEMIDSKVRNIANCARFFQSISPEVDEHESVKRTKKVVMEAVSDVSRQSGDIKKLLRDTTNFFAQKESCDILGIISSFLHEVKSSYEKMKRCQVKKTLDASETPVDI